MSNTHFVGCVVQKSKGAVAYLVYRASSFMPELPKTSASDRVAWSLAEVYACLAAAFPLYFFTSRLTKLGVQVQSRLPLPVQRFDDA